MILGRCRTGTSSNSPSPTSSSISASPGSRRLSRREQCSPSRLPPARCGAGAHSSTRKRTCPHGARRPSAPQSGVDAASHPPYRSSSGQPCRSGWLGFPIRLQFSASRQPPAASRQPPAASRQPPAARCAAAPSL
jgi:hypothetical protein